jgi:hypothetical protein
MKGGSEGAPRQQERCRIAPPSLTPPDYFWAMSELIDQATDTIMILDWWLSPELQVSLDLHCLSPARGVHYSPNPAPPSRGALPRMAFGPLAAAQSGARGQDLRHGLQGGHGVHGALVEAHQGGAGLSCSGMFPLIALPARA